jgi:hypothetical protein
LRRCDVLQKRGDTARAQRKFPGVS